MRKSRLDRQLVRAMRREPGFLDLICRAVEVQQNKKPKSPDDLRRLVLAKQKKGATQWL